MLSFFSEWQPPNLPQRVTTQICIWNIKLPFFSVVSACKPLLCCFSIICWPLIKHPSYTQWKEISFSDKLCLSLANPHSLPCWLMIWMEALAFLPEQQHYGFTVSTHWSINHASLDHALLTTTVLLSRPMSLFGEGFKSCSLILFDSFLLTTC